ncbi:glycosyltransferase family 2 protein [Methylobacter sp. BlB1]|uniref:glycosyltransferase family 2 protein n=1 Tax=Methylobacter sp. BlB1 TaxID=2785914 RepID=UPI001893D450|nr:glycosyltransferase family 2 protein [Methylobacter sp. BlB1]MBF6650303.1 glycosyltransferase family 2 protein [Methylobacter sp. BlB1]
MDRLHFTMKIDILIPTYNRAEDLIINLQFLEKEIVTNKIQDKINVIISDNCSTDSTRQYIDEFIKTKNNEFSIFYYRNDLNIGLERNVVQSLKYSNSDYVIFLGDDDLLAKGYLNFCIDKITNNELGCIIPGLLAVGEGKKNVGSREIHDDKFLAKGYESIYGFSHFAHQMSGLLCLRNGLIDDYLKHPGYRNPYLFIYFIANRLSKYDGVYAPRFQTMVNVTNEKDWSYNDIGLLDDVYKSYYPFIELFGEKHVAKLLLRFTVIHSYRIDFNKSDIIELIKKYIILISLKNISGFKFGLFKIFIKDYIKILLK